MTSIDVRNPAGSTTGSVELPAEIFDVQVNVPLIHQVVVAQLAAARQGTHDTKSRGEVRGGGRKPYKQKGTGRARQGSTRAPQFTGGGVVHGPTPRSYAFKVPNKVIKLAMRSVLSAKNAEGELYVIESFGLDEPSTKKAAAVLQALGIDRKVTVVVDNEDINTMLSLRNIERVRVIAAAEANTYDLVDNTSLLFTKPALTWLEGVLS